MKIVIKIGSAVLTGSKGSKIDKEVFLDIVSQIKKLKELEHSIVVVTSGAVASSGDTNYSRALNAAIGQPRLMSFYSNFFKNHNIEVCQFLFLHEDLDGKRHRYTQKLLLEAISHGVVPIVNANDAVSSEELDALKQYADNDILAERVAVLIDADIVFILSDQRGLIDFGSNKIVREVEDREGFDRAKLLIKKCKSPKGKGGMASKIRVAENLCMVHGIEMRLLPGRQENAILDSFTGKEIGTVFKAKKRP